MQSSSIFYFLVFSLSLRFLSFLPLLDLICILGRDTPWPISIMYILPSVGLSVLLRLGKISFTKELLPDTRAVT